MAFKVGDTVTRVLAGVIPMELRITAITEDRIVCGDYEFDKATGAEIDDFMGFGPPPKMTGSFIRMPGVDYVQASDEEALAAYDEHRRERDGKAD